MSSPKEGNLAEAKPVVYPSPGSTDSKHLMLDSHFAELGPAKAGVSNFYFSSQ